MNIAKPNAYEVSDGQPSSRLNQALTTATVSSTKSGQCHPATLKLASADSNDQPAPIYSEATTNEPDVQPAEPYERRHESSGGPDKAHPAAAGSCPE